MAMNVMAFSTWHKKKVSVYFNNGLPPGVFGPTENQSEEVVVSIYDNWVEISGEQIRSFFPSSIIQKITYE